MCTPITCPYGLNRGSLLFYSAVILHLCFFSTSTLELHCIDSNCCFSRHSNICSMFERKSFLKDSSVSEAICPGAQPRLRGPMPTSPTHPGFPTLEARKVPATWLCGHCSVKIARSAAMRNHVPCWFQAREVYGFSLPPFVPKQVSRSHVPSPTS